jgi:3',5'-cyclic AMP phosphodiesterase CpdA
MNFIHLSDTHIRVTKMERNDFFPVEKTVDDGARLRKLLRAAKHQIPGPDFALITGDLVHEGAAGDYRFLKNLLDEELGGVPYFVALGNHDRHGAFWEGFMDSPGKTGPYYTSATLDGLKIITLDSSPADGMERGALTPEQIVFLRNELAAPSPRGSILIMHHPMDCVYSGFYPLLLADRYGLKDLIREQGVRAVFTGHTHFPSCHASGNTLFATASGSAFGIDFTNQAEMRFLNAASYYTGRVSGREVLVGLVDMKFGNESLFHFDMREITKNMAKKTESPVTAAAF